MLLKALSQSDFSEYFETTKARVKRRLVSDRNCCEGDNIKTRFVNKLQFGTIFIRILR